MREMIREACSHRYSQTNRGRIARGQKPRRHFLKGIVRNTIHQRRHSVRTLLPLRGGYCRTRSWRCRIQRV
ncbi:MAG: hypothetical protein AAB932_01510, partial [Patescibacteria group bacterium]